MNDAERRGAEQINERARMRTSNDDEDDDGEQNYQSID